MLILILGPSMKTGHQDHFPNWELELCAQLLVEHVWARDRLKGLTEDRLRTKEAVSYSTN